MDAHPTYEFLIVPQEIAWARLKGTMTWMEILANGWADELDTLEIVAEDLGAFWGEPTEHTDDTRLWGDAGEERGNQLLILTLGEDGATMQVRLDPEADAERVGSVLEALVALAAEHQLGFLSLPGGGYIEDLAEWKILKPKTILA